MTDISVTDEAGLEHRLVETLESDNLIAQVEVTLPARPPPRERGATPTRLIRARRHELE